MPVPEPPENRVRTLSYSSLSLYERCSYRFYAERIVGLRETRPARGSGEGGLAATEIGDAVHVLLEGLDLASPEPPADLADAVRARYPTATDDEVARVRGLVEDYCRSDLARRIASLPGASVERSFSFEHDGVLLRGRVDVFHEADGRAFVLDYKTNVLEGATPAEVVEREYRLQRLVYALAILRAGASEVEVVYQFLERPDELGEQLVRGRGPAGSGGGAVGGDRGDSGREFRPTPSDYACPTCPALDLVCAGPRLDRVVRSFVAEARRRVGPKRARIVPIVERLADRARGRDDRAHVQERARAARLGDALGADDRREREPRHAGPVPQVPPARGLPRRAGRGARARHPADRLLPAEDEVAARDDADADRGVRRRGAATLEELMRLPGVARKTANVVASELGDTQGIVVDTHVRRLSQRLGLTRREDPVKIERDLMKLVPRERLGRGSRTC